MHQIDHDERPPGHVTAYEGEVVLPGRFIQEMRPCQMRLSPVQRQEPTEAADIGGRQGQVGVATAEFGRQEVQGEVMAANGDNGSVKRLSGERNSSTITS